MTIQVIEGGRSLAPQSLVDSAYTTAQNTVNSLNPAISQLLEQNGFTQIDVAGTVLAGKLGQSVQPAADEPIAAELGNTVLTPLLPGGTPSIYIGAQTLGNNAQTRQPIVNTEVATSVLHELGHALDSVLGDGPASANPYYSETPQFLSAVERDLQNVPQSLLDYMQQSGIDSDELFAILASIAMGANQNDTAYQTVLNQIATYFPNSLGQVSDAINSITLGPNDVVYFRGQPLSANTRATWPARAVPLEDIRSHQWNNSILHTNVPFVATTNVSNATNLNSQTSTKDPLVLRLGNSPVQLTTYQNGQQFDMSGDGFAVQTAWLQPGSNEAFLVYDPSNNPVTSGSQLFGVYYPLPDGSLATSGFQALASLDSNGDGIIDQNDPGFANLRLLMPDGSLQTLAAAGITSLNCSQFSNTSVTDANGNQQLDIGSFTIANGTTGFMGDYNLIENPSETTAVTTLPVSPTVAALPNIAGQGIVYSLHQAMMHDSTGTLQSLVEQFIATKDPTQQESMLEQIMSTWAGANPQSQDGANPEHIAVDSNFAGITYSGVGPSQTGDGHGIALDGAYQLYKENAWAQLMSQSQLAPIFNQITSFSDDLGNTYYDLSGVISYLEQDLQNNYQQGVQDIANTYRALVDLGYDQTAADFSDFYSAFSGDPTIKAAMDAAGKAALPAGKYFDTADPNMLMDLTGANGTNVFAGIGDTLLFDKGDGQMSIAEGTDLTIALGTDISSNDVYFTSNDGTSVTMKLMDSNDSITFGGQYNLKMSDELYAVQFADGTRLTANDVLNGLAAYAQPGQNLDRSSVPVSETDYALGNDTVTAGSGDDTIIGGVGIETLTAGTGNDTLVAAQGTTTFKAGSGSDTFEFGIGDGTATIIEPASYSVTKSDSLIINDTVADTTFFREYNDLKVKLGSGDTLTINNEFGGGQAGLVNSFSFADGNYLTLADVENSYLNFQADPNFTVNNLPNDNLIVHAADNDTIMDNAQNDTIYGANNDTIWAGQGQAHIYAGTGSTAVMGASGNDTFTFTPGSGSLTIEKLSGNDTLTFGAGISQSDLKLVASGSDLLITFANSVNDQILLKNQLSKNGLATVQHFSFADGSTVDFNQMLQSVELTDTAGGTIDDSASSGDDIIQGSGGAERILLGSGDSTVFVASGNTVISSGAGNDTFVVAQGAGTVTIDEPQVSSTGSSDKLELTGGFTPADVSYSESGNDLLIQDNIGDQITLKDVLQPDQFKNVSQIEFSTGGVITPQEILSSFNTVIPTHFDQVFELGTQAETLGFGFGSGTVKIDEAGAASNNSQISDTLSFGPGITRNDLLFSSWDDNLIIRLIGDNNDSIDIVGPSNERTVGRFQFADGTTLTAAQLPNSLTVFDETTTGTPIGTIGGKYTIGGGATSINQEPGFSLYDELTYGGNDYVYGQGTAPPALETAGGTTILQYNEGDGAFGLSPVVDFGAGINPSDLSISEDQSHHQLDIRINDGHQTDVLTVELPSSQVPSYDALFNFADGLSMTMDQLIGPALKIDIGSGYNGEAYSLIGVKYALDLSAEGYWSISLNNANDIVDAGDATIIGGNGDDTFSSANSVELGNGTDVVESFGTAVAGYGSDTFEVNNDGAAHTVIEPLDKAATGNLDKISFGAGLSEQDLLLSQGADLNDLVVGFSGTTTQVVIQDALNPNAQLSIGDITFSDGTDWTLQQLLDVGTHITVSSSSVTFNRSGATANDHIIVSGNNDSVFLGSGDDLLTANGQNSTIAAGSGNDSVALGTNNTYQVGNGHSLITNLGGNDTINGGAGSYTLQFGLSSGSDTVKESYTGHDSTDNIVFGAGISLNDLILTPIANSTDLTISLKNSAAELTLQGQLDSTPHMSVVSFEFADGQRISTSELIAGLHLNVPTVGAGQTLDQTNSIANENFELNADNDNALLGLGNDTVTVTGNNDYIKTNGTATISIEGNNATIESSSGSGSDIIAVGASTSGLTLIEDSQSGYPLTSSDTLILASAAVNLAVSYSSDNNRIALTDTTSGQTTYIQNPFGGGNSAPKPLNLQFTDGSVMTLQQLLQAKGLQVSSVQVGVSLQGFDFNEQVNASSPYSQFSLGAGANQINASGVWQTINLGYGSNNASVSGDNSTVETAGGNDQIALSGNNDQLIVNQGFGTTGVFVEGNNATIESKNGSGSETITLASNASGFTLTEDAQQIRATSAADTLILNSLAQNLVLTYLPGNNQLTIADSLTGQQFVIANALTSYYQPSKPIDFQFSDGSKMSLANLLETNGLNVSGGFNTQVTLPNISTTTMMSGTYDSVSTGLSNADVTLAGDQSSVYAAGNSIVNLNGDNDTVTLTSQAATAQVNVNGNNATIESQLSSGNATLNIGSQVASVNIVEDTQRGDTAGTDIIKIAGLAQNQKLSLYNNQDALTVQDTLSGQQINLQNVINSGSKAIEFEFSDGTSQSLQQLLQANGLNVTGSLYVIDQSNYGLNENVNFSGDLYQAKTGNDNITETGSYSDAQLGGGNDYVDVTGSYDSVSALVGGGNDYVDVTGSYDSVSALVGGSTDQIDVAGTNNTINIGAGTSTVNLLGVSNRVVVQPGSGITNINVENGSNTVESQSGSDNETIVFGAAANSLILQEDGGNAGIDTVETNWNQNDVTFGYSNPSYNYYDRVSGLFTLTDAAANQELTVDLQDPNFKNVVLQFADGSRTTLFQYMSNAGFDPPLGGGPGQGGVVTYYDLTTGNAPGNGGIPNDTLVSIVQNDVSVDTAVYGNQIAVLGNDDMVHATTAYYNNQISLSGQNDYLTVGPQLGTSAITILGTNDQVESQDGSANETITIGSGAANFNLKEDAQNTTFTGTDTLVLNSLVGNVQASFTDTTGLLTLTDSSTGQQIHVQNWLGDQLSKPIVVQFADGTSMSLQSLLDSIGVAVTVNQSFDQTYVQANETITAYGSVYAGVGNDTITSYGDGNQIALGAGNDQLTVFGSNDSIQTAPITTFATSDFSNDRISIAGNNDQLSISGPATGEISSFQQNVAVQISGQNDFIESQSGSGNAVIQVSSTATALQIKEDRQSSPDYNAFDTIVLPGLAQNQQIAYDVQSSELTITDSTTQQQIAIQYALGQIKQLQFTFSDGTSLSLLQLMQKNGIQVAQASSYSTADLSNFDVNTNVALTASSASFNSAAGQSSTLVSGNEDTLNLEQSTAQVQVSGNDDVVNTGSGTASIALSGTNDTVKVVQSFATSTINVDGQNDVVQSTAGSGDEHIEVGNNASGLVIQESAQSGNEQFGTDVIALNALAQNIQTSYDSAADSITFTNNLSGQQVTIDNIALIAASGQPTKLINLQFSDGSVISLQDFLQSNKATTQITTAYGVTNDSSVTYDQNIQVDSDGNQVYAGSGDDVITVASNNSYVQLGAGNDQVTVTGTGDWLQSGTGTAELTLQTSTTVYDTYGKAMFTGTGDLALGTNNDTVTFSGNSTIALQDAPVSLVFGYGSGNDVVDLSGATANSILLYGDGVTANDLILSNDNAGDTIIALAGSNDVLTLEGEQYSNVISRFSLSDGSEQTVTQVQQTIAQQNSALSITSSDSNTTFDESGVAQNATIVITGSNDTIDATALTDTITVSGGQETIFAGAGNDVISASNGGNTIHASTGAASIVASGDGNTIYGGAGVSTISINSGEGSDTIVENTAPSVAGQTDILSFGTGIAASDLTFSSNGYDLTITVQGGPTVTLADQLDPNATKPINEFQFADGSSLTASQLLASGISVAVTTDNTVVDRTFSALNESVAISGTNDAFSLGSGSDTVSVTGQSDSVVLGTGNAQVQVGGSGDTISGGTGASSITITGDNANLNLASGTATVAASGANDVITAGSGADQITVNGQNDTVSAGSGNDTITLGSGDTTIYGGSGASNFIFSGLGGNDTIYEQTQSPAGLNDTLTFTNGILQSDLALTSWGTDLTIGLSNGDPITLKNALGSNNPKSVNTFIMSDGTQLSLNQLASAGITVNDATDNTVADRSFSAYNETINVIGAGDTVYAGSGTDVINVSGANASVTAGTGNDVINVSAASAQITGGSGSETINISGANAIVSAGNGNVQIDSTGGHATFYAGSGSDSIQLSGGGNTVYAGSGTANLVIGQGDNEIFGGSGSSTFEFDANAGTDTIYENTAAATAGATDTVSFGTGITSNDLSLSSVNDDLIVSINNSNASLILSDELDPSATKPINAFAFSDGTSLDLNQLTALGVSVRDSWPSTVLDRRFSTFDEIINVIAPNDTVYAGSGNDTITASAINDVVYAGSGDDQISAESANDVIYGGNGTDTITATDSNDAVYSGSGSESINLSGANDTIFAGAGAISAVLTGQNDAVYGSSGAQTISLSGSSEAVYGGSGQETVAISGVNDSVVGGSGSSSVSVQANNATIHAGSAAENVSIDGGSNGTSVFGGSAASTITINANSGNTEIYETVAPATPGSSDTVVFGPDITSNDIILSSRGFDLTLAFGGSSDTNDQLTLANELNPSAIKPIENFQFSDGSTLTLQQLLSQGVNVAVTGNNQTIDRRFSSLNESISVSGTNDVVYEGSGNDVATLNGSADEVYTGAGNDIVNVSGAGDTIFAGSGNTTINAANNATNVVVGSGTGTYNFGSGATELTVESGQIPILFGLAGTAEALQFANCTGPQDLSFSSSGYDLTVGMKGTNDSITIQNELKPGGQPPVPYFEFYNVVPVPVGLLLAANQIEVNSSANDDVVDRRFSIYNENIQATGSGDKIYAGSGRDLISASGANSTIFGGTGDDTLSESGGNDTVVTGTNHTTIEADNGQGSNTVKLSGSGTASVSFGSDLTDNSVIFYRTNNDLQIGYMTSNDILTIQNEFATTNGKVHLSSNDVNQFTLSTGQYLTDSEVNRVINEMSAYAAKKDLSVTSINDVKSSPQLMEIIAESWHNAPGAK